MRRLIFQALVLFLSLGAYSQEIELLNFDPCYESISDKTMKKFEKAFEYYKKNDFHRSSIILREIIAEEEDFASAYFLIALIGSYNQNQKIIEKYIPLVTRSCSDFHHPMYFYFKGLIDYSNERYSSAIESFNLFFDNYIDNQTIPDSIFNEVENYLEWSIFLDKTLNEKLPFNPIKVNEISTSNDEFFPYLTLDREMFFFTRRMEIKIEREESFFKQQDIIKKDMLCMAKRKLNGDYEIGKPLDEPFNLKSIQSNPSLTSDNREMFFTQCDNNYNGINCDIYYSQWLGDYWSKPINIGHEVNRPDTWESQPCISPNGKTLYFVSDRPGGIGGTDIWISYKQVNGSWGRVENAGSRVNTIGNEKSPFLHPDGNSLYFSSNGWKTIGGFDNFYIDLGDRNMKTPINLGYPINTKMDEDGIMVDINNQISYLSTNNYNWDIYSFYLIDRYSPLKTQLVRGRVKALEDDYKGVSIELLRFSDKKMIDYDINPKSGEFTLAVLEGEEYLIKAKSEGYAFESRIINKYNYSRNFILELSPLNLGDAYVINDILFETNSYDLTQEAKNIILEFVDYLNQYPKIRCTIEGHTDNIGCEEENLILSEKRAKSVADFIIKSRVREDRIQFKGFGSKKPIGDNLTPEGRAKNRRTLFRIDSM